MLLCLSGPPPLAAVRVRFGYNHKYRRHNNLHQIAITPVQISIYERIDDIAPPHTLGRFETIAPLRCSCEFGDGLYLPNFGG